MAVLGGLPLDTSGDLWVLWGNGSPVGVAGADRGEGSLYLQLDAVPGATCWTKGATANPAAWTILAAGGAPATPHNILSLIHADTQVDSVVRGDVIVGNATPKWARLAKGTTGFFFKATATDAGWAAHGLTYTDVGADPAGAAAAVTPATLGLVIGTNVEAHSARLDAIAALADAVGWLHNNGAGVFAYTTPPQRRAFSYFAG